MRHDRTPAAPADQQMTLTTLGRRTALLAPLALLSGCGIFSPKAKKPVPGVKIPVLPPREPLRPSSAAPSVSLPAATAQADWPQAGGNPQHASGSVQLPAHLSEAWSRDAGAGAGYRRTLVSAPVIAKGRVFTVDANGVVEAHAVKSGQRLWRAPMRPKHDSSFAFGGGLAADADTLYVATGFSELRALDAATGKQRWTKKLGQPARSAPGLGGGQLYVILLDNTLVAYDVKHGDFVWRFPTSSSANAVFGAGTPAYQDGIVVAGFGTGLLAGIRAISGSAIWEQSLAAGYDQSNPLNVSSILASPVIANDLVFATGLAGTTVAFDLRSGRRIWGRTAGASETPAAAGDWLFLLTTDQKLAAIHQKEGYVAWVTQLPQFENPEKSKGPISWHGPLLAGHRLILAGSDRRLVTVDALTGTLGTAPKQAPKLRSPADLAPVAADGALFVLTRNAVLSAWR